MDGPSSGDAADGDRSGPDRTDGDADDGDATRVDRTDGNVAAVNAAGLDAAVDPRLRVGDVTVDERDVALLRAIAEHGSLNAAADALGRSYSRSHARISALEDALGPLVDRERGGPDGGGSRLTDAARDLLARYERLAAAVDGTATTERLVLRGTVTEREGDLATVETPVGAVRALALGEAEDVQVAVPADAVTLHADAGAPDADETSARNRFAGTVDAVEAGTATARVAVDVGVASPLVVRVTTESLDRLDLAAGTPVVATVKATATRATPAPGATPRDESD